MGSPKTRSSLLGSATLHGGFFLIGIVSVLLGPLIPELKARWGISDAQAATLFVAQFVASSAGAVASTVRLRLGLTVGYALISAGLCTLAWGGWSLARPAMALAGTGLGLTIPATNILVSLHQPGRRGAALATLNTIWGVGATSCPLIFAALVGRLPISAALTVLAALTAVTAVLHAFSAPEDAPPQETQISATPTAEARAAPVLLLGLFAAMQFLYVGSETAVGGWLVELSDELSDERTVLSLLIGSGFWGALLAGRAGAAVILRVLSEHSLYRISLAVALGGVLTILLAEARLAVAVGALLAGLGLASLYPLTVSILTARTAATRSKGTGWIFACAGVGGAALPWLTGQVAEVAGTLRHGFFVPLAGLALLTMCYVLQRQV